MSHEDRDWRGYIRSLSRDGPNPSSAPQELQRSGGADTEMGWEAFKRYMPGVFPEEYAEVLELRLQGESAAPVTWSSEEEENFREEIQALWDSYESDQKEIKDNKGNTKE